MGNTPSGEQITAPVPGAPAGSACSGNLGDWNDGYCHSELNTAACGYDGGDCCPSTCSVGNPFTLCSYTGTEDCEDPNAEENGGLKILVNYLERDDGGINFEVTVTGAQPGAAVKVWVGDEVNPFVIPDTYGICPGYEVDVEFGQLVPESYIADDNGRVLVEKAWGEDNGRHLSPIPNSAKCGKLFQAIEEETCKKSNVAFLQELRPQLWNYDTCNDHGFQWCNDFACPEPPEYRNCCQLAQFWCDVAVGCSADHNGTPDATTGPDLCRAYWLAPDYYFENWD